MTKPKKYSGPKIAKGEVTVIRRRKGYAELRINWVFDPRES